MLRQAVICTYISQKNCHGISPNTSSAYPIVSMDNAALQESDCFGAGVDLAALLVFPFPAVSPVVLATSLPFMLA